MALPIALLQTLQAKKKQRQLNKDIANAPKYKITDEAYDNQAIARSEAYGRDRAIQGREKQMDSETAQAVSDVQDVTTGTSSLLSTIAAIRANQDVSKRALAVDEASLKSQKKAQLIGVNNQMIDEKDKAWNYNENMPYQMKVAALRDRIKYNQEQAAQQFAASSNFMTNMFAGGGFNYQQPNSQQTQPQGGGASMGGGGGSTGATGGSGGMMKGMGQMGGMGGGMMMSDKRLKKEIHSLDYGLAELMELKPVEFEYNDSEDKHLGFIAQDVQKVIPEAVLQNSEFLGIKMHELIPVLVKSVQELQLQVQSLREQLAEKEIA